MGCKVQQRSANLEVRKYAVRLVLENIKKMKKKQEKHTKMQQPNCRTPDGRTNDSRKRAAHFGTYFYV